MQIAMIKNIYYLFYFRLYFCTVMIALILAKIRKINEYVSLNMVLFNGFSSVIEKGLKFGYMVINIKHSAYNDALNFDFNEALKSFKRKLF